MRKLLIILMLPYYCFAQNTVIHRDTTFIINGNDSSLYTVTPIATKTRLADSLAAMRLVMQTNYATTAAYPTTTRLNDSLTAVRGTINGKQPTGSYLVAADITGKANIASPAFTGTPTGIGIPVYAQVTGSNATTTGQVLTTITGLSVALVANATYEFEAVLSGSTTAVTTGTAYGMNFSAAGAAIEAQITGAATSTATKTLRINALNTATALYLATSAQTGGIVIKGIVTTGVNAGNLVAQHLKLTSGTSTVMINSFLKVTRIL
jgi:hypothetical protein